LVDGGGINCKEKQMAMNRNEKSAEVAAIQETFKNAEMLLLAHNKGLNAKATNDLRVATRAAGVNYRVTKNTLAKIAIKGTPFEVMADQMKGPVAYVTGNDPVATAKVIAEFAKKNDKLVIVGAKFGDMIMDADKVKHFATLPTLDEIRSQLIGLVMAPAQQIAAVVKAYADKDGEAGAPAPEAASAE
jgi:large subunit ribosomal protein L10